MTNLAEYTTDNLRGQHNALMTSIMIVGKNNDTSDVLYDFAIKISNEIEKREGINVYKTDIMFV